MLKQLPTSVYSSPDGSCFLALMDGHATPVLRAFHWSTFGTSEGIPLDLSMISSGQSLELSSFIIRKNVHLLILDSHEKRCHSIILDITAKNTEFMFKQKGARVHASEDKKRAIHNSIIDCHLEVWTR